MSWCMSLGSLPKPTRIHDVESGGRLRRSLSRLQSTLLRNP